MKKNNRYGLLILLVAYAYFIGAIGFVATGTALGFDIMFGLTLWSAAKLYGFI